MGPLKGLKIIEIAGIGPGPFAAMVLADLGADVLRIERKDESGLGLKRPREDDYALRNRPAIRLDLKNPEERRLLLDLVEKADGLIEGFRPGVMERLGIGPGPCLERNPRLIFGRLTGWGQTGPLAQSAGHDLNYIAVAGVLHGIGRAGQPPSIPFNLVGDFAGGSLYLVIGMLSALLEARNSGKGQVVDAAMVDGVASLSTPLHGMLAAGLLSNQRGTNFVDSGSHFYDVYECSDGKWVAVAPVEPKFYTELLSLLEIEIPSAQLDRGGWKEAKEIVAARIRTRTREEWCKLLEGTDACFAPVLDLEEARAHAHVRAREIFVDVAGRLQPAPAPRFNRTAPDAPRPGVVVDRPDEVRSVLNAWLGRDATAGRADAHIS